MKRLPVRVFVGGFLGGLMALASASCSSTPSPGGGGGNNTGGGNSSGAGNIPGTGGASSPTGGAAGSGVGGNSLPQGGTGTGGTGGSGTFAGGAGIASKGGTGGTGATGGASADACSTDPNLVVATGCYVGCDPASTTDDPQGIQGAFYTFGDGPAGGPPKSCSALMDPPCTDKGICLSGTTLADKDYATGWGCGIGLELNNRTAKMAYAGPATCFDYTLTGSSGGNEVRLSFTQSADTAGKVSPYLSLKPFTNGATGTICLKDVSCPTPAPVPPNCTNPMPSTPYDLQFEVVGANNAGTYNVCLTSLKPVTNGTSTLTQLCGAQGSANATEAVGKYFAQNNVNTGDGSLCMTPALNGANASFKVDSATFTHGTDALAAYPSIVDGWHYGHTGTDTALPKIVSTLTSVNSTAAYVGSNGKYDASYDIWVLPTATAMTPANGLEVMLWLNSSGVNPACCDTNTTYNGDGGTSEVWNGTVSQWKYIAYRLNSPKASFNGNLLPYITNAITLAGMDKTKVYLAGVEFGFELYDASGASGFQVSSFTCDVK